MTKPTRIALAALAAIGCVSSAQAQSADTLIDVLVDKGVLTVDEAKDLRQEADKDFTRAYASKSGMPSWVTALKFSGDFRGRFDGIYIDNSDAVDRNRWRYRLRFGFTALMLDNFEVGLRLGSGDIDKASGIGSGIDPISQNQTFQNNGSKKGIFLDLAYGKWYMLNQPAVGGSFTFGKMKNPFDFSSMVFDKDYTPEGGALQFKFNLNHDPAKAQTLNLNLGAFILDEVSGSNSDPYFLGAQVLWKGTFGQEMKTTGWNAEAGVSFLTLQDAFQLTKASVPNTNDGNTRDGTGALASKFNPIVAQAALGYTLEKFWMYNSAFPITLSGEYIYNPAASSRNQGYNVGVVFGKSGKRRLWELSYMWKSLEADAWYEQFVDSDFGAYYATSVTSDRKSGYQAGTNVRGHVAALKYSPANSLTLGATAFITELIDKPIAANNKSDSFRVQVDAQWQF